LLLRSDIDAIIVALPIKNQPEYIEAALKAGKHVLSEKPIAENLKDAEHVIRFYNIHIDKSKVTWGVAENFRFLESYAYAGQQVEKLGKVLGFQVKAFSYVKPGSKWYSR
jgi:predicted dehydrogenase